MSKRKRTLDTEFAVPAQFARHMTSAAPKPTTIQTPPRPMLTWSSTGWALRDRNSGSSKGRDTTVPAASMSILSSRKSVFTDQPHQDHLRHPTQANVVTRHAPLAARVHTTQRPPLERSTVGSARPHAASRHSSERQTQHQHQRPDPPCGSARKRGRIGPLHVVLATDLEPAPAGAAKTLATQKPFQVVGTSTSTLGGQDRCRPTKKAKGAQDEEADERHDKTMALFDMAANPVHGEQIAHAAPGSKTTAPLVKPTAVALPQPSSSSSSSSAAAKTSGKRRSSSSNEAKEDKEDKRQGKRHASVAKVAQNKQSRRESQTMAAATSEPIDVNDWKRMRSLGCGTFGCVHEIRHPSTGERAALKVMGLLPDNYKDSRDGLLSEAFRVGVSPNSAYMVFRELAAMSVMRGHPGVPRVREARMSVARSGLSSRAAIECVVMMDLMDGHLGRIVHALGGRGRSLALSDRGTGSDSPSPLPHHDRVCRGHDAHAHGDDNRGQNAATVNDAMYRGDCPKAKIGRREPTRKDTPSGCSAFASSCSSAGAPTPHRVHARSSSSSSSSTTTTTTPTHNSDGSSKSKSDGSGSGNGSTGERQACSFALRVRIAWLVARDVLPALAFMHDNAGMAHRDIKPNNILYSGDPSSGTLRFRLADFGLARFMRLPWPSSSPPSSSPLDTAKYLPRTPSPPNASRAMRTAAAVAEAAYTHAPQKDHHPSNQNGKDDSGADDGDGDGAHLLDAFTGNVITHLYKPPEILLSYRRRNAVSRGLSYGCAADMWSFGMVLLEVLAGGHLTPTTPESTLVSRLTKLLQLNAPDREHVVRDLVRCMALRAMQGRSGLASVGSMTQYMGTEGVDPLRTFDTLMDLLDRLMSVDPDARITSREALTHPFVVDMRFAKDDGHGRRRDSGSGRKGEPRSERVRRSADTGPAGDTASTAHADTATNVVVVVAGARPVARFLGPCGYRALRTGSPRATLKPDAGPDVATPTMAARRVIVRRMCQFAQQNSISMRTFVSAVHMLDHYLDRAVSDRDIGRLPCSDVHVLRVGAGALLVACNLYERIWPSLGGFSNIIKVPPGWHQRAGKQQAAAREVVQPEMVLAAAVTLFEALGHMTPDQAPVTHIVAKVMRADRSHKDTHPWQALSKAMAQYPPLVSRIHG